MSRAIELFIVDIFVAARKVEEYTRIFHDASSLRHDSLHWDATIRQLEVIGEALNNLLDDEKFQGLAPGYFRKVVNFRNAIAHGYFGIDEEEVWNVVDQHLETLQTDLTKIVTTGKIDLRQAIAGEIEEYGKLGDEGVVDCLHRLSSLCSRFGKLGEK